jgi:hypothetical protein
MQRKTERPVSLYGNYRSGIIPHRYASIASTPGESNDATPRGGPPANEVYSEDGADNVL